MIFRRQILPAILAPLLISSLAFAGSGYEPKRGSLERKAILNALRPAIEAQMRGPVEFVIHRMRIEANFAFVIADPQRPGGASISFDDTAFAGEEDYMDGLTVYALLAYNDGWHLLDHAVGPTDVFYEVWPEQFGAPPGIMGLR